MKTGVQKRIAILVAFTAILLTFIGMTMVSFNVLGENNDTTIVEVNISNTAPSLYNVTIADAPINLVAGNTTVINCTGLVYDANGYNDVSHANATLYDVSEGVGDGTTFDNNFRYRNTSCTCVEYKSSTYNASCSCFFIVYYYANNGSWACNMTIEDNYGLRDTNTSGAERINSLIGIWSKENINYGNLSVTEYSTEKTLNITNFGNVEINVSVRGYGGTGTSFRKNPSNSSLNCQTGNMSLFYERYSTKSGVGWVNMLNISNASSLIQNFTLPQRTNDTGHQQDTNNTYWMVYIPSGISGKCNGSLEFLASIA